MISLDVETDMCRGCGRCAAVCQQDVFSMRKIDGKVRAVCVWSSKCTGCGRCTAMCPQGAIELEVMSAMPELAFEM